MSARAWWCGALAVGGLSAGSLGVAALAPLLIRAPPRPGIATPLDLICLLLPTRADWAAHLVSYSILGLLLVVLLRGVVTFGRQMQHTRRALWPLLALTRPPDPALAVLVEGLGLTGRVHLIPAPEPIAFCYGVVRPHICLSTGMVSLLTREELAAVLWHERLHLLRRDPLKVALGRAWTAMFFFLPLVRVLYRHYVLAKEVDADAYACAQQGNHEPLATALCVLLEQQNGAPGHPRSTATAGATDQLEARVDRLLGEPRLLTIPMRPALLSGLLVLGLIGLELALTEAGTASTLWYLSHTPLGGC